MSYLPDRFDVPNDEAVESADSGMVITALYTAQCGAQVTVRNAPKTVNQYTVACEACGDLHPGITWMNDKIPNNYAQEHAATCRRVPMRLWPKAGA